MRGCQVIFTQIKCYRVRQEGEKSKKPREKEENLVEYKYDFSTDGAISPFVLTTQVLRYQEWTPIVMNPGIECGGLQHPEKVLQAPNMTSLSLARDYVTGEIGTSGCEASPDLYGSRLNMARGLTKCLLRQTA